MNRLLDLHTNEAAVRIYILKGSKIMGENTHNYLVDTSNNEIINDLKEKISLALSNLFERNEENNIVVNEFDYTVSEIDNTKKLSELNKEIYEEIFELNNVDTFDTNSDLLENNGMKFNVEVEFKNGDIYNLFIERENHTNVKKKS